MNKYSMQTEYNFHLTLEQHLADLGEKKPEVKKWYDLWNIVKNDFIAELKSVGIIFQHYSVHDEQHSKAIISNIELFLGDERIRSLSVTDTFMMLCCFYSHDICMSVSISEIEKALQGLEFKQFLQTEMLKVNKNYAKCAKILYDLQKNGHKEPYSLYEVYNSFIILLEEFFRKKHTNCHTRMHARLKRIFGDKLLSRLINDIVMISNSHGNDIDEIMQIPWIQNGMISDYYHPRFIAAMLRLGDLLDLDNGRFGERFLSAMRYQETKKLGIPEISQLHYRKHESVQHFFISPKSIEVKGYCGIEDDNLWLEDCENKCIENWKDVAKLLSDWLATLENEITYLNLNWTLITGNELGYPPSLTIKEIYLCGKLYSNKTQELKMNFSRERAFGLLKGDNIYSSKLDCIHEIIQNAIDASLIQLWEDLYEENYMGIHEMKDGHVLEPFDLDPNVFSKYPIYVTVGIDPKVEKIYIEVSDNGTGISMKDLKYISMVGENKDKNIKLKKTIESMPDWLKPAGLFGIGMQSVFEISDKIEILTKSREELPKKINFYSISGSNNGDIEVIELQQCKMKRGCKVKFYIDSAEELFNDEFDDLEFDGTSTLDAKCINIRKYLQNNLPEYNYFEISLNNNPVKKVSKLYFPNFNKMYFPSFFQKNRMNNENYVFDFFLGKRKMPGGLELDGVAFAWDKKNNICYQVSFDKQLNKNGNIWAMKDDINERSEISVQYKFKNLTINEKNLDKLFQITRNLLAIKVQILDYPADDYVNIDRRFLSKNKFTSELVETFLKEFFEYFCRALLNAPLESVLYDYGLIREEKDKTLENLMNFVNSDAFRRKKITADNIKKLTVLVERAYLTEEIPELKEFTKILNNILESINGIEDLNEKTSYLLEEKIDHVLEKLDINIQKYYSFKNNIKYDYLILLAIFFKYYVSNNNFSIFFKRYGYLFKNKRIKFDNKSYVLSTFLSGNLTHINADDILDNRHLIEKLKLIPERKYYSDTKTENELMFEYKCKMSTRCNNSDIELDEKIEQEEHQLEYLLKKETRIKRVLLKPNSKYSNIIVAKAPKNYQKSEKIFQNLLEMNLKTFILSPIEEEHIVLLDSEISSSDFYNKVKDGELFKKCVKYVLKYHYQDIYSDTMLTENEKERMIYADYEKLIKSFYKAVVDYKDNKNTKVE